MSTIRTNISLRDQASGTGVTNRSNRVAFENTHDISTFDLDTTAVAVNPSTINIPRDVVVINNSGDDILVSLDTDTTYYISVQANDFIKVSLDVANHATLAETSTVVAEVDVEGTMAGLYFDLTDQSGYPVRVWLNTTATAEVGTIVTRADVADDLDATFVTLEGNSGTWAIWNDTDNSGTAEPAHLQRSSVEVTGIVTGDTAAAVAAATYAALIASTTFVADFTVVYDAFDDDDLITITDKFTGDRVALTDGSAATTYTLATPTQGHTAPTAPAVPVTVPVGSGRLLAATTAINATAIQNAVAIAAALDADAQFISAVPTTATLTVTDQYVGTRTIITDGDTTWTLARTVTGAVLPVVYVKSKGNSEVQVMVAPN